MPIFNRNQWTPLIMSNLRNLQYPRDKLEFVMDDDGTEKFFENPQQLEFFEKAIGMKVQYFHTNQKRTIGKKRDNLVKKAKHKIIAFMDSDDMYLPTYLLHSIDVMTKNKASLVGSPEMLFMFPDSDFKMTAIKCMAKRQIHEATMVFTKKHWRSQGGFINNSQGEGAKMIDFHSENKIATTNCQYCMVCIAHKENTVNKEQFKESQDITDCCNLTENDKNLITMILNGSMNTNRSG
jgi:hypothetical protein